jgi:hypothetical protein
MNGLDCRQGDPRARSPREAEIAIAMRRNATTALNPSPASPAIQRAFEASRTPRLPLTTVRPRFPPSGFNLDICPVNPEVDVNETLRSTAATASAEGARNCRA